MLLTRVKEFRPHEPVAKLLRGGCHQDESTPSANSKGTRLTISTALIPWPLASFTFPWLPQNQEQILLYVDESRHSRSEKLASERGVSEIVICVDARLHYSDASLRSLFPFVPASKGLTGETFDKLTRLNSLGFVTFNDVGEHSCSSLLTVKGIGHETLSALIFFLTKESLRQVKHHGPDKLQSLRNSSTELVRVSEVPVELSKQRNEARIGKDPDFSFLVRALVTRGFGNESPLLLSQGQSPDIPDELISLSREIVKRSAFEWLGRSQVL